MSVIITGRIADSAGALESGRIEFEQAQRFDTGDLLVTGNRATAQVTGGELRSLAGAPFTLPSSPEGTAVRVREMLGGRTFEWWTSIPEVAAIEYRELVPVEGTQVPASIWGPPPWLAEAIRMRDETLAAIDDGKEVAESLGGLAGINAAVASAQASAAGSQVSSAAAGAHADRASREADRAKAAADSIDMEVIEGRLDGIDAGLSERPTTAQVDAKVAGAIEAVYVRDFTAPWGGDVDVRAAIQQAVDRAAGLRPVVFERGVYGVAAPVVLPEGSVLLGRGATIAMMDGSGTGFAVTNFSLTDTTTPGYAGASNIRVRDITFDGQGDRISRRVNLLTFNHARNIRVDNCRFIRSRGYHALEVNAIDGAIIEGCSFEGFVSMGLSAKEAIQVDCGNQGSIDSGLRDGTMAKNITIRNCRFSGLGTMPAHDVGVGSHSRSNGNFYDNIRVENCSFTGHTVAGVEALAWRGSSIESSVFSGCLIGAKLLGGERSVIADCSSESPGGESQGFVLAESSVQCAVDGCTVIGAKEGVSILTLSEKCSVSRTITRNTIFFGIVVAGASDTTITGNSVFGAGAGNPAASTGAIRLTTSLGPVNRASVVGNVVRPHGIPGNPEAAAAVSIAAGVVDAWVFGNDFKGMARAIAGTADTTSNRI